MKDFNIVLSLTANNPDELSMLTVQVQLNWGMKINFFDFSQTKNGKYICWFEIPHAQWVEKVMNGQN